MLEPSATRPYQFKRHLNFDASTHVGQSPAGHVLSGLHGATTMLHPMLLEA